MNDHRQGGTGNQGRPAIGRGKLWVFRIGSAVVFPLALLSLLEVGLRVVDYGFDPSFWIPANREHALQTNPRFGWRFFAPTMNQYANPTVVDATADAGSIRIVVFGGSAANGWPTPLFAFSRILEAMLDESFPETDFEVINTGVTAINSHVVLPILRDTRSLGADIYIVYLGNNEVVGPFGAGSVIQGYQPSLGLIRANLALRATRFGQLLANLAGFVGGGAEPQIWRGMEMFVEHEVPAHDPRLEVIYEHLRHNLIDIVEQSRKAGADLILATPLTNLRSLPPFVSASMPAQPRSDTLARMQLSYDARKLADAGDPTSALPLFETALGLDPGHAASHYEFATSLVAVGHFERAATHFTRARDLDALRFRADSRILQTIREVAQATGTPLVDTAEEVDPRHASGIVGEELLLEHVHPTFEGNYAIAEALFAKVVAQLRDQVRDPDGSPSPPSAERCADRIGLSKELTYREGLTALRSIAARPPFDPAWQSAAIERWKSRHAPFTDDDVASTLDLLARTIDTRPDDLLLREMFARELQRIGRAEEAVAEMNAILDRHPDWEWVRRRLADLLLQSGQVDTGIAHARAALELNPGAADAYQTLASGLGVNQSYEEAIAATEQAIRLLPEAAASHFQLGLLLLRTDQPQEAESALRAAAQKAPQDATYAHQFARVLWRNGSREDALESIYRAASMAPDSVEIQVDAARFALKQRQRSRARHYFARAGELDPEVATRHPQLARALSRAERVAP